MILLHNLTISLRKWQMLNNVTLRSSPLKDIIYSNFEHILLKSMLEISHSFL